MHSPRPANIELIPLIWYNAAVFKQRGEIVRLYPVVAIAFVLALSGTALADRHSKYILSEGNVDGFALEGTELSYYYYIPSPPWGGTWFHALPTAPLSEGYVIGQFFRIGDISTGGAPLSDPSCCHLLEGFRVLDFAGYGCSYPQYEGLFTVAFDVYCSDESGCPIGPSLWNSGPVETCWPWTYLVMDPPLDIAQCYSLEGPPPSAPRILITATHVGSETAYPTWGLDNVSTPCLMGSEMHDISCLPALYPRPFYSHYETMHSGYYGPGFEYCPPQWFKDPEDDTPDGSLYGYLELVWKIYVDCSGASAIESSTTWGAIKSMYR